MTKTIALKWDAESLADGAGCFNRIFLSQHEPTAAEAIKWAEEYKTYKDNYRMAVVGDILRSTLSLDDIERDRPYFFVNREAVTMDKKWYAFFYDCGTVPIPEGEAILRNWNHKLLLPIAIIPESPIPLLVKVNLSGSGFPTHLSLEEVSDKCMKAQVALVRR